MHDETKVYFIEAEHGGEVFVKIGMAVDAYARITTVVCGCPIPLSRVRTVSIPTRQRASKIERQLHKFMGKFHIRGEWFKAAASEMEDFDSHIAACLNMEIGVNAWKFGEIDWAAHEAHMLEKRKEYLRTRDGPARQSRRSRGAEWNRFRRFDARSGT